jgi:hypothetical protein
MPRYLIERQFQVGQEQMPEVGRRSRRLVEEQFPQISWEHSHVAVDEGGGVKTFCIYEAPSEDVVRQHAKALGLHELEGVYEIAGDVTPSDFPL